ncbi:MAG: hypothetical protein Kow00114_39120 [Kiloniellaceae bacterium]
MAERPKNPLAVAIETWLASCDFGVMSHGFAKHGRDYVFIIEDSIGRDPGTHRLTFTHVVSLKYETAQSDESWRQSWDEHFIDYDAYLEAGEPEGYVWGTNWSNAWPGVKAPESTPDSLRWSEKLGYPMFEMSLETDRFRISMIFHELRAEKLSSETATISQSVIPLG